MNKFWVNTLKSLKNDLIFGFKSCIIMFLGVCFWVWLTWNYMYERAYWNYCAKSDLFWMHMFDLTATKKGENDDRKDN